MIAVMIPSTAATTAGLEKIDDASVVVTATGAVVVAVWVPVADPLTVLVEPGAPVPVKVEVRLAICELVLAGVPVLVRVATIFLPISPDLPIPVTITRPLDL